MRLDFLCGLSYIGVLSVISELVIESMAKFVFY